MSNKSWSSASFHDEIEKAKFDFYQPKMTLPNDIARCDGVSSTEDGITTYREGCEHCLRRTAPRPERFPMIEPPKIIAFQCEHLIEAFLDKRKSTK